MKKMPFFILAIGILGVSIIVDPAEKYKEYQLQQLPIELDKILLKFPIQKEESYSQSKLESLRLFIEENHPNLSLCEVRPFPLGLELNFNCRNKNQL